MTPPPRKPTPLPGTGMDDEDWENSDVHESLPARPSTAPGYPAAARAQPRDDGGRATARKALAKIDELGKQFNAHAADITKRLEEHAKLDHEQFKKIDDKLEAQGSLIGDLREVTAANTATTGGVEKQLAGLTSELRLAREREVKLQVAEREAELADKTDTKAHERKVKFEWGKIIPALLIAGGSALITAIATGKL